MRSIFFQCIVWCLAIPVLGQPRVTFISNTNEVCLGDSAAAYLQMYSGESPWTITINNAEGEYRVLKDIDASSYVVYLKPEASSDFYISAVEDGSGTAGVGIGTVYIEVRPLPGVSFLLDKTAYLKTDGAVSLSSDPGGARFYGKGVFGSLFYPSVASTEGSPHTLGCEISNQYGCKGRDEKEVYVIHGEAEVLLLSGEDTIATVCEDDGSYEILGTNKDQQAGLFSLYNADNGTEVLDYILDEDSSDNKAVFEPGDLTGTFVLKYHYDFESLPVDAEMTVNVNDLQNLSIEGFPSLICQADEPYLLSPGNVGEDPDAIYTISGPGMSGDQEDGFYFDPAAESVSLGYNTITLEYTTSNGCSGMEEKRIRVNFSPEVSFTFDPSCLTPGGGTVEFTNTTTGKYAVEKWVWNFGDPDSGDENTSEEENPNHLYSAPGRRNIVLTAYAQSGCISATAQDTVLPDNPVADMIWLHDCYQRGLETSFLSRSESHYSTIDSVQWTFKNDRGLTLGVMSSGNPEDTVDFLFTSQSNYLVELDVWDQVGCHDKIEKEILLRPSISVPSNGFSEGFNGGSDGWLVDADPSSWVLGTPNFSGFAPTFGDDAWYTNLPVDPGYVEDSWVESPCFDLGQSYKPVLMLDMMRSLRPGLDGAVVQYQEADGEGWKTFGEVGEGSNWYNVNGLVNKPGGSDFGWGLDVFSPDRNWVTASRIMDELVGKKHIKFRIALASGGTTGLGNQGFAFDNFRISEDFRGSLLEHFTNASQDESMEADQIVDSYAKRNSARVIDVQYHTQYPGHDPMYENSSLASDTRFYFYGLPSVPYAILNGRSEDAYRYNFSGPEEEPSDDILEQISLESPVFQLVTEVDWQSTKMDIRVTATCSDEPYDHNVDLFIVLMEHSITTLSGDNGDTEFRNVVLEMLPTPAGTLLGSDWAKDESRFHEITRDYPDYVEDEEELILVAFLWDRTEKQVLQAVKNYHSTWVGEKDSPETLRELSIYPNPARDMVYLNTGKEISSDSRVLITDLSGKLVMQEELSPGYSVYSLDVSELNNGMYVVHWMEAGQLAGRAKLIRQR